MSESTAAIGYRSLDYLATLGHVGTPIRLPRSDGWLLERPIPGTRWRDCTSPYPVLHCDDWERLGDDIEALRDGGVVSVVFIADPFGNYAPETLDSACSLVRNLKDRWIVDLRADYEAGISAHHRKYSQRALRRISVEHCTDPMRWGDVWASMYNATADRRCFPGHLRFSTPDLIRQLSLPGVRVYRACRGEETVGISLWVVDGQFGYGHLAAYTAEGRQQGAAYALYSMILRDLAEAGVAQVDLGSGVGDAASDGLARWKAGWTSERYPTWLCGAVTSPQAYRALTGANGEEGDGYFPGYRAHR
jgi:hypothetical protein